MIFHPGSSRGNFNRVPPGAGFSHAHTSLLDSTDLLFSVIAFDVQMFSYYLQKVVVVKRGCDGKVGLRSFRPGEFPEGVDVLHTRPDILVARGQRSCS